MQRLYVAADLPEAHLVANCHAWPEVWLLENADAPRAQRALDAWQRTPRMLSWRCRDCGEDNPGTFETCWHCGAPLMP